MIPDKNPYNNWSGNGSATTFDFDFYIEDETQLAVYHTNSKGVQTLLKFGTDYLINELKNENGSFINFPINGSSYDVLGEGEVISLCLTLPIAQENPYGKSSYLDLKALEYSLDYLTRICQIMTRELKRSVKVQEGSNIDTDILVQNINQIVDNIDKVQTVSAYIHDVVTTALNIKDVNTTASHIGNVDTVSGHITKVDTVADHIGNVDTVSGHITKVDTVADHIGNVDTVSGHIDNIDITASHSGNIDIVSGSIINVNKVSDNISNINIVSSHVNNIDIVSENINSIDTTAIHISNVDTVADIDDSVVDVAANKNNINIVATNIEDVQNASNLIKNIYNCLNGGTASSSFTERVSGGNANSVFTSIITGGNASTVGTVIGDVQSDIRVIQLNQKNDKANIIDIYSLIASLTESISGALEQITNLQGNVSELSNAIDSINSITRISGGDANSVFI